MEFGGEFVLLVPGDAVLTAQVHSTVSIPPVPVELTARGGPAAGQTVDTPRVANPPTHVDECRTRRCSCSRTASDPPDRCRPVDGRDHDLQARTSARSTCIPGPGHQQAASRATTHDQPALSRCWGSGAEDEPSSSVPRTTPGPSNSPGRSDAGSTPSVNRTSPVATGRRAHRLTNDGGSHQRCHPGPPAPCRSWPDREVRRPGTAPRWPPRRSSPARPAEPQPPSI